MQHILQKRVVDAQALQLIQGQVRDGDDMLVDTAVGELMFSVVEAAQALV